MMRAILLLLLSVVAAAEDRVAGQYRVTLRPPADGLYAQEEVEIELRIEDTSRPDSLLGFSPVIRAQVDIAIDMPAMPGMPAYRESAHPEGVPGDYGFHPTFPHGGDFRVRVDVTPPRDQAFRVEFPIHVLDADSTRKKRPPRFSLELTSSPKSPKAGEPVDLRLMVRAREQPKQPFATFDVAHEKLMHLVVVRTDLTQFAHEHPELSQDGVFRLRRTFREPGEYHLFADVAPKGAGSQVLMATLRISGKRSQSPPSDPLPIELKPSSLPAKTSTRIEVVGLAASPETYLGAAGHLILIHEDAVTFVHSHPIESDPLTFLVRLPKAGRYHAWLQVQRNGEVLTTHSVLESRE